MKLLAGTVTITTAGTRQRFAPEPREAIYEIVFIARKGNTGNVYLGDAEVSSTSGLELQPGVLLRLDFTPGREATLADFYGDAASDGDMLDYLATAR